MKYLHVTKCWDTGICDEGFTFERRKKTVLLSFLPPCCQTQHLSFFFSMLHLPWRALSPHSERTAHKTPNLDYLAATILSHCSSGAAWTDKKKNGTKNRCFTNRKANITPCDGWKPFWLIGFMLDCLVLLRNVHYIDFDSFFFWLFITWIWILMIVTEGCGLDSVETLVMLAPLVLTVN